MIFLTVKHLGAIHKVRMQLTWADHCPRVPSALSKKSLETKFEIKY